MTIMISATVSYATRMALLAAVFGLSLMIFSDGITFLARALSGLKSIVSAVLMRRWCPGAYHNVEASENGGRMGRWTVMRRWFS